jgi:hypothetical protein
MTGRWAASITHYEKYTAPSVLPKSPVTGYCLAAGDRNLPIFSLDFFLLCRSIDTKGKAGKRKGGMSGILHFGMNLDST